VTKKVGVLLLLQFEKFCTSNSSFWHSVKKKVLS